jgi:hypothetical protein
MFVDWQRVSGGLKWNTPLELLNVFAIFITLTFFACLNYISSSANLIVLCEFNDMTKEKLENLARAYAKKDIEQNQDRILSSILPCQQTQSNSNQNSL